MKKEVYLVFSLGTILLISSCSFPHWFVSHRHVTVEAAAGNAPEIVQVRETMVRKSSFSIEQYFRSKTLNVSEKSFSVSYQGKLIQPKVYASFPNEKYSRRLKELTTIPPMTLMQVFFKVKRKQGDTIRIVEHDVPQTSDSIVINVEIPEMDGKRDDIDRYNFSQLYQLSNGFMIDPTKRNGLYYDLKFEDGVCIKDFVVDFGHVDENILHGNMEENMNLIMEKNEVPQKTLNFLYHANIYNISISNDCDLSYMKNKERTPNEKLKIRVKFFENVKQPYNTDYPFAIIESISPNQ